MNSGNCLKLPLTERQSFYQLFKLWSLTEGEKEISLPHTLNSYCQLTLYCSSLKNLFKPLKTQLEYLEPAEGKLQSCVSDYGEKIDYLLFVLKYGII